MSKILKEKVVEYQKVQTTSNQVYTVTEVTQQQTTELTTIVNDDNADGCEEHFCSALIDNVDETVGLSEKTSWRVKGRYVAEPLIKPMYFDVPSMSGTKKVPREPVKATSKTSSLKSETHDERPKPKANMHKTPK